ncbi:MAG: hypothetical protein KAR25_04200 [Methanosarcinales archaeon]|nr:hypothetical protein [Methanosarcinales archaeon]
MLLISIILYLLYTTLVLILLIRISTFIAAILLLGIPLVLVLALPDQSVAFLSHQQAVFGDGLIPINNLHILLFIWSSLIAVILYTEFITWYLGRGEGGGAGAESAGAGAPWAGEPAADDLAGSDEPADAPGIGDMGLGLDDASGFPDEPLIGGDGGFPGDFGMGEESELGDFDGFPG